MKKILPIFFAAFLAACQSEPFTRAPLPPLKNTDADSAVSTFQKTLPTRRTIYENTLTLEPPFRDKIVALAELVLDPQNQNVDLVALTPIGVTLFQLSTTSTTTTIHSAIPPLMAHKEILESLATDLRHIYFDLTPEKITSTQLTNTTIELREKSSTDWFGTTIYQYGGDPCVLLEKRYQNFFTTQWRIRYYNYTEKDQTLYPQAIAVDNHQFHYRLILKVRTMEQP